jgi:hypothetical protein
MEFTKEERTALKELAKTRGLRWWKNYPFIIAVFGFFLSLSTALWSIHTSRQKDLHDQLAELATAVRTIHELDLKRLELRERYRGRPDETRAVRLIGNQLNNTVLMAADIALRVGTHATTSSLIAISEGLYTYSDFTRAEQVAQLALDAVRGPDDDVAALSSLALMRIRSGSERARQEAQELFDKAANVEHRHNLAQSPTKIAWLKASVQLRWAGALAPLNCDEARQRFTEAAITLNSSGSSQDLDRLRVSAHRSVAGGIGGVRSCTPAPETPVIRQPETPPPQQPDFPGAAVPQ